MPDLVIKPTAGAGNKLILQDQGGGTGAIIENATITNATLNAPVANTIKLTPGSAPGSPVEGQMYYNDVDNVAYIYNGTAWNQLSNRILDGSTAALAPEYGSDIITLGKPAGLYWLTGASISNHPAQQVYVDSSGWMLYYRHAGTGGSYNSTYEITGDALGEGAIGTLYSPTQGLTDTGSSTTAGSRGVARLATNFVRALGGESASGNVIRITVGSNTAYMTDCQNWYTQTTSDGYGYDNSTSYGMSYAGRRTHTNHASEPLRPIGTYIAVSSNDHIISFYHGNNYSGGYDGTWHVATTIWIREY